MAASTERKICGYLNKYLFWNIWNEPLAEYRTNARLKLLSKRAYTGSYRSRYDLLALPTGSDAYLMYSIPVEQFAGFDINVPDWTKLSEFNLDNLLHLQVYDSRGIWLWREAVYIRIGAVKNSYLLAVNRKMIIKCLGSIDKVNDLFLTKYFDSDLLQDNVSEYYTIKTALQRYTVYDLAKTATTVYVNGRVSNLASAVDLKIGDYVEINKDKNVITKITVDLGNPDQHISYTSSEQDVSKTLIHIPKLVNPSNSLITWNTCDVYVTPKNITDAHLKGLFMHKCDRRWVFRQITHNDFSIDSRIYQTFSDALGTSDLIITVLIRSHNKNNKIVRDINYIDLLYTHDDATIIKFFKGQGPANFEFWTADHLEDSVYGRAMYDIPDDEDAADVGYYIDVLGYNNALSLICDRTKRFTFTREQFAYFNVDVPLLFIDAPIGAIVYLNGLKVPDNKVSVLQSSNLSAYIYIKDENDELILVGKDDEVVIELFENPTKFDIEITNLNETNAVKQLTTDDIMVWKKITSGYVKNIHGQEIETYGMERLENYGEIIVSPFDVNKFQLTLSPNLYGQDIVISSTNGMYKLYEGSFLIDEDTSDYTLLATPELRSVTLPQVNIAGPITYLVYLNGRHLTKDMDYSIVTHKIGGDEIFTEIVLQNLAYIESNNTWEVYGVRGEDRGHMRGFVSGSEVTAAGEAPFWFDNLSVLVVDGKAISKVESLFGQVFIRSTNHRNGSPYLLRTLVSAGAINCMDKYRTDIDTDRLLRLRDYFSDTKPFVPGLDLIPCSHSIFSIYTCAILRDYFKYDGKVIKNSSGSLDDPDTFVTVQLNSNPEIFMEQFSSYNWLKKYDTAYQTQDLDYLDVYPMYHRCSTNKPEDYHILKFLFETALPYDLAKYKEMIYE